LRQPVNVNHSTNEEISRILNISMRKIDRVKRRFVEEGLEVALHGEKSDRIYAKKVDGDVEAHLVALSCSEPPEGFAKWSLRLLADKAVELGYVEDISHKTVRRTLKKRNQTLAKERMGNSPGTKQYLLQIWKWFWMFTSVHSIQEIRLYVWTNPQNN
jgi:transposase